MLNLKSGMFASVLNVITELWKRAISIISLVILARILTPEDFGLVAISLIFLNFVSVASVTGGANYMLSQETITHSMAYTCWTLNLTIKGSLAILLILSSYAISNYYEDERLIPLICVFSFQLFVECLGSPGFIYKMKRQEFKEITKVSMVNKVVSTTITISIAIIYETYWALVIGQVSNSLVHVVATHVIAPMKLRLTFENIRAQWGFTKWILPQSLVNFFRGQVDAIFVSTQFAKPEFGAYNSMRYYASIPTTAIINPATSPLIAQFSEFKSDKEYLLNRCQVVVFAIAAFCALVVYTMGSFSSFFVNLVLGEKWLEYSSLLAYFSLMSITMGFTGLFGKLLMLQGRTKMLFVYSLISTFVQVFVFVFFSFDNVFELAKIKVYAELFSLTIFMFITVGIIFGVSKVWHFLLPAFIPFAVIFMVSLLEVSSMYHFQSLFNILSLAISLLLYILLLLTVVYLFKSRLSFLYYIHEKFLLTFFEKVKRR